MRHADAECDLNCHSIDDEGYLGNTRAQSFSQAHSTVVSSFAEQTNEFLAPIPSKEIGRAQVPLALGSHAFGSCPVAVRAWYTASHRKRDCVRGWYDRFS